MKKRPSKKKLQRQQRVLERQSDEIEFFGQDGPSLFGGTIAKGFLFEYLADKPGPDADRDPFCILDEQEGGDGEFDFVPSAGGWDTNWSTQFAR